MNKPINRNGKEWEREEPRPAYITERIKEAIRDLTMALREIEQQKTIQFDD